MPVQTAPENTSGSLSASQPKVRKNIIRTVPLVDDNQLGLWEDENVEIVKSGLQNIVTLSSHSLREHQRRADDDKPPSASDPSWSPDDLVIVHPTKPTFVCDRDGVMGVFVIPSFLKPKSLSILNEHTLEFMERELAPRYDRNGNRKIVGASTNGKARGGEDTYVIDGATVGTATYVLAYHQQAHENSNSFEPSRSLTYSPSGTHSHLRARFFSATRNPHRRINHLVELVHPRFSRLLNSARPLLATHPTVAQYIPIWDSLFLGHSVICNRTSGEHTDRNGLRRGLDVLLAAGNFRGGDLYFKDMNIQVKLEPGTLVLFDGTAQRHRILEWSGQQRISHAFFVHRFVFEELGLDCLLPDITTSDIQNCIEALDAKPKTKKRKRRGQGRGRAYKQPRSET